MREFKTAFEGIVDLDDPDTYSYMANDIGSIRDEIHKEIGYCYCYFNYWHKPWDEKQEARVEILIKKYTDEWSDNRTNLHWHKEMLYIFQDEIENMC